MVKITQLEARRRLKRFGWRNKVRTLFEAISQPGTCYPGLMKAGKVDALLRKIQPFEGRLTAQNAHYGIYIEMKSHVHGPGRLFFETCVQRTLTAEQLKDSAKKGRAIHLYTRKTVRTPMSKVRIKLTKNNRKMVGTPHYFKLRKRSYRQKVLTRRISKHMNVFDVQAAKEELARMRQEARLGRSRAAIEKWIKYRQEKARRQLASQSPP